MPSHTETRDLHLYQQKSGNDRDPWGSAGGSKDYPCENIRCENFASSLLDKDFAKDVSLKGFTDETLLNEVDGMTDLLYEKQGSYQQGLDDRGRQDAQLMVDKGILTPEKAAELFNIPPKDILPSKH